MEPQHALDLLNRKLAEHGLTERGWTGGLDNAVRRFGVCMPQRKRITLSRHLATINSDEETLDTVLHEIAHALAWVEYGEDCGHDERWQAIAARIGARPERTVDVEEASSVAGSWFLVHSETGEVFNSYHKRPQPRDLATIWIRGRRAETEGKLTVVSARDLAAIRRAGGEGADTQIRSFDRPTVHELSKEISAAVAAVCEQYGLTVELAGGRFDPAAYHFGYTARVHEDHAEDGDRAEFELHAALFGLESSDFGRQFTSRGKNFKLVGFKPRNRKYPVIGLDGAGGRYKFPSSVLQDLQ